jgi:hypothetical protein
MGESNVNHVQLTLTDKTGKSIHIRIGKNVFKVTHAQPDWV